ncbi:MAG: hypothetical protein QGD94_11585, partial [Planctomycetia bacterium]|nr:hypothetical protein [Planctomycetia bacterium]
LVPQPVNTTQIRVRAITATNLLILTTSFQRAWYHKAISAPSAFAQKKLRHRLARRRHGG